MKLKLNVELVGIDGVTPLPTTVQGKTLTLKEVCITSILTPIQGDTEKVKLEKWDIFKKLRDNENETVELKVEEVTILKKAIGGLQPPLIMGQAFEMLER